MISALQLPDLSGGLCKGLSPAFDGKLPHENAAEALVRMQDASRTCWDCPVLAACKRIGDGYAGVWGGEVRLHQTAANTSSVREYRCRHCGRLMISERQLKRHPSLRSRYRMHHGRGWCTGCRSHGREET